ncbi:hypothetical protein D3C73_653900 [compost metagenome]
MENSNFALALPRLQAKRQITDRIFYSTQLRLHARTGVNEQCNAQRSGLGQLIDNRNHLRTLQWRKLFQRTFTKNFFYLFINRLLNRLNHRLAGHHLNRLCQLRRSDDPADSSAGFGNIRNLPAAQLSDGSIIDNADHIDGDPLLACMRRGHHRTLPYIRTTISNKQDLLHNRPLPFLVYVSSISKVERFQTPLCGNFRIN